MIAIRRSAIDVSVSSLDSSTHNIGRVVTLEVPGAKAVEGNIYDMGGGDKRNLLVEVGGGEGGQSEEEGLELHIVGDWLAKEQEREKIVPMEGVVELLTIIVTT